MSAVCPPGTYQVLSGSNRSCQKCPKGSYCPGGTFKPGGTAAAAAVTELALGGIAAPCAPDGVGLTTKAEGATKSSDCSE